LITSETAFELLPRHAVVDITPIPPETNVVPPSGGLNTKTSAVPGCVMSAAVMIATNCWLLTKDVIRNEPFQLTAESWRNSLPLTVRRNRLRPAVALLGVIEVMNGVGGQVPQDTVIASKIGNTDMRTNLGDLAIGLHLRLSG